MTMEITMHDREMKELLDEVDLIYNNERKYPARITIIHAFLQAWIAKYYYQSTQDDERGGITTQEFVDRFFAHRSIPAGTVNTIINWKMVKNGILKRDGEGVITISDEGKEYVNEIDMDTSAEGLRKVLTLVPRSPLTR